MGGDGRRCPAGGWLPPAREAAFLLARVELRLLFRRQDLPRLVTQVAPLGFEAIEDVALQRFDAPAAGADDRLDFRLLIGGQIELAGQAIDDHPGRRTAAPALTHLAWRAEPWEPAATLERTLDV